MTRATQGLLLAFVGAVLLRLSLSDAYLRYVNDWMKWPIAASGALLVLLAIGPILSDRAEEDPHVGAEDDGHDHSPHRVPRVTWLLLVPGIVAFVISPPALGAFLAERRVDDNVVAAAPPVVVDLAEGEVVPLGVEELIWRSQEAPDTLVGQAIELTGFVSYDGTGAWYVTRMSIACCAADASAFRVKVEGAERPERDSWVAVTGTWVEGSGTSRRDVPSVEAVDVKDVEAPTQTYQ